MAAKLARGCVSKREAAKQLGLSRWKLDALIRAGVVATHPKGGIALSAARKALARHDKAKGGEDAKPTAAAELAGAKAEMARAKVDEMRGRLVNRAVAEEAQRTTGVRLRSRLLELSDRLAPVLAPLETVEDTRRRLRHELRQICDDLSLAVQGLGTAGPCPLCRNGTWTPPEAS